MDRSDNFNKILSTVLTDARDCSCTEVSSCEYAKNPWCRNLTLDPEKHMFRQYDDFDISYCVYRNRPGCCWVLDSIETLAKDYLKIGQYQKAPVPLEAINLFGQDHDIELRFVPLKAYHGVAWLLGNEWVIQVNSEESKGIQRNTIFHEAFHIACRNASPAFKRMTLGNMQPFRELIADHFATCFLMPREWVKERWETISDIGQMSDVFEVSTAAMTMRLKQLGLTT